MDLVQAMFAAVNRGDAAAAASFYAADCVVDHIFAGDDETHRGAMAVEQGWAREFERFGGAFEGGRRFDVPQIAGMETGWGWVRAEWVRGLKDLRSGIDTFQRGYSHFLIDDGRIRRHRSIVQKGQPELALVPAAQPTSARRYPSKPMLGVGGIVFNEAGDVLLVKRKHEPLALQWSLPGGTLDVGETLESGTAREIREETGVIVEVGPLVEVFDRILLDEDGKVRYHFVLVDYLCRPIGGTLEAQSDASECAWVPVGQLREYRMAEKPRDVIARAVAMKETSKW
jgi:8-oxo-dGTP diphosphatase